ncbi:MAG: hypothetical protein ACI857_000716 [Arenicella sp.]|jgi:hypothetical protein
MKTLNILLITAIAIIASSCGNRDKEGTNVDVVTKQGILVTDFEPYRDNARTEIKKVALEGNVLNLSISYSGGCAEHEFSLIGSKMISKSLPPQRGITLFHNSNGDSCRELVDEELAFNISDFAYLDTEIILKLEGWAEGISYTLK